MSLTRRSTLALAILLGWFSLAPFARAQASKPSTSTGKMAKDQGKARKAEAKAEVDLNSATLEELQTLTGIGEAYARKIIDSRPHSTVADLSKAGVPASTIAKLKGLATVEPLPPAVDVNEATLSALEELPGVGPVLAKQIIAARPLAGYDDLAKLKGFGPAKIDALKGRLKFGTVKTREPAKKVDAPVEKKVETREVARETPKSKMPASTTTTVESRTKVPYTGPKININKATLEELQVLPGIGPVKSQAIIDARPFNTIEDIMKTKGIKEGEFSKIKDMITVK
jgi:competence protein ComEA